MDSKIIGIHHLGIAVSNIQEESRTYIDLMGYNPETEVLLEPPQKVYVQFLTLNNFRVELIEPTGKDSPIMSFMEKGGVLNHICYESSDLEASVASLRKNKGMFQTVPITKASTLKDCSYSFFAKPTGEVIELIYFNK